jgi:hypothetical protein
MELQKGGQLQKGGSVIVLKEIDSSITRNPAKQHQTRPTDTTVPECRRELD